VETITPPTLDSSAGPQVASNTVTLSVIVVSWNVRELLRDCLCSLREEMEMPAPQWEVIVVDNASGDGSAELVQREFADVALIANRNNTGFARANNQALQSCRGEFVLLLNPDAVVREHAIDRMLRIMRDQPGIGALGCKLLNTDGSLQRWTGGAGPTLWNIATHFLLLDRVLPRFALPQPLYLEGDPREDTAVGWTSAACMLLRREALGERIFDERFFMYCEDLDLCQRLLRAGWKVMYTPRAAITHHDGKSLAQQTRDVQASKLRSLRAAFAQHNPHTSLVLYDLIVSTGFLMRSVAYLLMAVMTRSERWRIRASVARQFLREAVVARVRR
jgi:GT2 family glycosyltransferase